MTIDPVGHLYAELGADQIAAIVAAFYRQVPTDEILGPMYPAADLVGAEERLRDFLIQRFGGPAVYSEARGHPRLRMRHAKFAIDAAGRDRWLALMTAAIDGERVDDSSRDALLSFLGDVATFLINRGTAP